MLNALEKSENPTKLKRVGKILTINRMKYLKTSFALLSVCFAFANLTKSTQQKSGEIWLAITHVMSKHGASAEATTAVGAIGVMDAAVWGFAVGSVGTPVAGMVAGAAAGF